LLTGGTSSAITSKCDYQEEPELFWALRGGGGNFGVVISMRIRLHAIREVLAGMILFPWSDAEAVFHRYPRVLVSPPQELSVLAGVLSGPDGNPMVFLAPMWSGEKNLGEEVIATFRRLTTPVVDQIGPMTYLQWLNIFEGAAPVGRHYAVRTRSLRELTPDAIAVLIDSGNRRTSPYSAIILHHFRGAATGVPLSAKAFGTRTEHFMLEIIAAWEPSTPVDGHTHRQWASTASQNLAPHAVPGGYPNMLGPDDHEQIARAYGDNQGRLQQAKQQFDPDGFFNSASSLPVA
jgi:FAD/FMN-containing dehydrogenase